LQALAWAQREKADSLSSLLRVEKIDSNRVTLIWRLADAIAIYNPDSAFILAQNALFLASRIHFIEGKSRSLGIMANVYGKMGKYAQALDYNIQKLKIEETRNNPRNLGQCIDEYRYRICVSGAIPRCITVLYQIRFYYQCRPSGSYQI
jgi:tetratricopeptide (TPR) repeat protein